MTLKPEFTMQINLGTLVPIGIALVGLASWTGSLGNQVDNLEQDVEQVQQTVQGYDARLRAIEAVQSGVNVRLDNIGSAIQELKETAKDTNTILRELSRKTP